VRQPSKCEAGIDIGSGPGSNLYIQKCHRPGRLFETGLFGMVLCDLHEHLADEWRQRELTMLEEAKRRKKK